MNHIYLFHLGTVAELDGFPDAEPMSTSAYLYSSRFANWRKVKHGYEDKSSAFTAPKYWVIVPPDDVPLSLRAQALLLPT